MVKFDFMANICFDIFVWYRMANLMQNGIPGMNAGQVPPSNPDVANAAPNIPNMPNMTPANGQPNIEGLLEVLIST